jgi:hypothetical protein
MKKPLSKKASQREASFWNNLKKALRDTPMKVCQK